jgi:hypothetical protein
MAPNVGRNHVEFEKIDNVVTEAVGGADLAGGEDSVCAHPKINLPFSGSGNSNRDHWLARYSKRHRPTRVETFPPGVQPPKRVRIYTRNGYYLLHFWDPSKKRTLYDRVNGDLIDAIAKARQIEQRLNDYRSSGQVSRRLNHEEIVALFREDLARRADAGIIALATSKRYDSALDHYLAYARRPHVLAAYPIAMRVDRSFALEFGAFLGALMISPNGRIGGDRVKMKGQAFVLDAVRAVFEWAADPDRGNVMPAGFRNPFRRNVIARRKVAKDMTGDPDITVEMSAAFLDACDDWQLRLFSPLVFYGLRPSELIYLFHERRTDDFLDVNCVEGLAHMTKGKRNKRLPIFPEMRRLLAGDDPTAVTGFVFRRRDAAEPDDRPPFAASLVALAAEFERRCQTAREVDAAAIQSIQREIISEAGGLTYKMIQGEFAKIAKLLKWPRAATLKDFRHACNTALANGGMSDHERRYLLGHDPGQGAIVHYTHLSKLTEHYQAAAERELGPLLEVLRRRVK